MTDVPINAELIKLQSLSFGADARSGQAVARGTGLGSITKASYTAETECIRSRCRQESALTARRCLQ